MTRQHKMLVVNVAALGWDFINRARRTSLEDLRFESAETVFPALTCPVQASFRTVMAPAAHGLFANGFLDRRLGRVFFWEQSARLIRGARIWEEFRRRGGRVAMLFWQQSMGENVDIILTPRPIHRHHGGVLEDCYSVPAEWYRQLFAHLGRPFHLRSYWGPLAGRRSSEWITEAVIAAMDKVSAGADMIFTYLPHLDYDLQRLGPSHPQAHRALETLWGLLGRLRWATRTHGYEMLVFGDYAMTDVSAAPVFLNRTLAEMGLLSTRRVGGRLYPDIAGSAAFAVVDHEVALVYGRDSTAAKCAQDLLKCLPGVASVTEFPPASSNADDDVVRPDFILLAEEGRWFAYPWWQHDRDAPDYAAHVDIHHKPGYDPCELFFGRLPTRTSLDALRVKGTHGRAGPGRLIAWASSVKLDVEKMDLLHIACALRTWLAQGAF